MEKAIEHFQNNIITVTQTAKLFSLNRKKFMKELKLRNINTSKFSVEKFIKTCNKIHNNFYNYSLITTIPNAKEKIRIICPEHGIFEQDVYSHKKGCGCPLCGDLKTSNSKKYNKEIFIEKANKIHNNLYHYENVNYINTNILVKIKCKEHGIFEQSPNKHLQGQGCPICVDERKGWTKSAWKKLMSKNSFATFYIIECYNEEESFIKIGRTLRTVKKRYSSRSEMPYNFKILKEVRNLDSDFIFDLEIKYKRKFKQFSYTPKNYFGGITECYSVSVKDKIIGISLTN